MKIKKYFPVTSIKFFLFTFGLVVFASPVMAKQCCVTGSNPGLAENCYPIDRPEKASVCASTGGSIIEIADDLACGSLAQCGGSGSTAAGTTGATTTVFPNPIGFTTFSEFLSAILSNLMGVIAFLSVIFIVIGGIMYIVSGGNKDATERAKKTIAAAVIGLAIALAAPTFLKEIQLVLGGAGEGENADQWVSNALTIKDIAVNVLNFLLSILGIFGIIALVISGGMYLTSYGDEDRVKTAKSIAVYAVIGIAVALGALVIVRQVAVLIGARI